MKKKAKKKAKKKLTTKVNAMTLQERRIEIMKEVPIMPCSALNNDVRGQMYAYTRAAEVYSTYRTKGIKYGVTWDCIDTKLIEGHYKLPLVGGGYEEIPALWVDATILFECVDTREGRIVHGLGGGDNGVWTPQSAQTVAIKQGVLCFYETAWPEPESFVKTVREAIGKLDVDSAVKVMQDIIPVTLMSNEQVTKTMMDFFANFGL